jgi:hypothetical protein
MARRSSGQGKAKLSSNFNCCSVSLKAMLAISVVGLLFSGFLTLYSFVSTFPGCEIYFLGMPSCFYGAMMFGLIFFLSVGLMFMDKSMRDMRIMGIAAVSFIGILFSSYLTYTVITLTTCTTLDVLGLPPCIFGLVMYLALLALVTFEVSEKGIW